MMLRVRPGGEVKAAFIMPAVPGYKPRGVVLVEQEDQWVTWNIYWDGELESDENRFHEIWECEQGNYFLKFDPILAQQQAEYDFGDRLVRLLPRQTARAMT